jgi:predicted alpha/beta superfamily hydrolase
MRRVVIIASLIFASYNVSIAQQAKPSHAQSVKPLVVGEVHELWSAQLGEQRTLNIYLPDGYSPTDTAKYPVVYLLDGGLDEDFMHVSGLVQFNSQPWVARVPRSIVVGIANKDRKHDLTFPTTVASDKAQYPTTGGSAKFIAFLGQDLQPYINSKFRTSGATTLIGESLGGLLATEVLFTRPSLFDKYIIISPSLWWDDGSLLKKQAAQPTRKTNIYIGVGKEGLAPSATPHVMEVDANLLQDKIETAHSPNVSVYLDYLPAENHATIGHQALFNAFRQLYPTAKP